jgi:hypothetical protein
LLAEQIYYLHFMERQQMQNGGAVCEENLLMESEWCCPCLLVVICVMPVKPVKVPFASGPENK